jgi:hypothetical protein
VLASVAEVTRWFMGRNELLHGWEVKMGGIARRIRRECLRLDGGGRLYVLVCPSASTRGAMSLGSRTVDG